MINRMPERVRAFVIRHQLKSAPYHWLMAGLGGTLAIALVGVLTDATGRIFIIAAFGASAVLLFHAPNSPFSQPINVVGGHVLSTLLGLLLRLALPDQWWGVAIAVGLAIAAMAALRLTHPPAGGDPIVVFATDPGWGFLAFPILLGAVVLVASATVFHRLTGTVYPLRGG